MYHKVYFILAHKNPAQIKDLISLLDDGQSMFFIHIDKKVNQSEFENYFQDKEVYFIKKRIRCTWGKFSLVQATINAMIEIDQFMEINHSGDNYHFIMLSGEDLPLQNNNHIHSFLENNKATSFMHYWQLPYDKWWEGGFFRLENIYLFNYKKYPKWNYWFNRMLKKLNLHFVLPLNKFKKNFPDFELFGNSQWMILTQDLVIFIIEKNKENKKFNTIFKYVLAPDELYFSSLIINYDVEKNFNIENRPTHLVVFAGNDANPQYLKIENIQKGNNETMLFARKFNNQINGETMAYVKQMISQ